MRKKIKSEVLSTQVDISTSLAYTCAMLYNIQVVAGRCIGGHCKCKIVKGFFCSFFVFSM